MTFGQEYAEVYDRLYSDKDYAAECDLLEELFRRYARGEVRSILDLGCGTGGHAFPLAERGYQLVGVERSAPMLAQARGKLTGPAEDSSPTFLQGDLQSVELGRRFDVVLMMFAVLGYQTTNAQVSAALAAARRHLEPGGLLVFDVWYGPAVLSQRPIERFKLLDTPRGQVRREATPVLDVRRHLCLVRYRLWLTDGDRPVQQSVEEHAMRYFFPMELEQFLDAGGFKLVHLSDFADLDGQPSVETWNVLACARAI